MMSVVDLPALVVALLVAAVITAALLYAFRAENKRREWITAGLLTAGIVVLGAVDIFSGPTWETKLSTVVVGAVLAVLSALGMVRATRRMRLRYRAPLVFLIALAMLLAGLLLGASFVSRALGF